MGCGWEAGSGVGEWGLEMVVGTRGQDRWLSTSHPGPWVSLIVLGFQERKALFFHVAKEIAEPGLERDSRLDSGLQHRRIISSAHKPEDLSKRSKGGREAGDRRETEEEIPNLKTGRPSVK